MLVAIREGKNLVGRRTRRWEYNIKMDLKDNGLESVVKDTAQNRDKCRALVNVVKKFRLHITCGEMGIY